MSKKVKRLPIVDQVEEEVEPTTMTIGNRTYEVLSFLRKHESQVRGRTMVERAKKMNANLGQKDLEYIRDHEEDIPRVFEKKHIEFVFPSCRDPEDPQRVACLVYNTIGWTADCCCWANSWLYLDNCCWGHSERVLRRKRK